MNVPYECFISKGEKSFVAYSINGIKNHFKNVAWISNNKKSNVKEGIRPLYEQNICCQYFTHFIPYSVKCSGNPAKTFI